MRKVLTIISIIFVVIILGLGVWWFVSAPTTEPTKDSAGINPAQQTTETSTSTTPATAEGITIVFSDNGFEKDSYSVAAGQTVTVKNNASFEVEFSSDDHPTHRDNSELNMDILQPGKQQTFTPTKAGTWGIHDHEHPEFTTTLVVTN